MRFKKVILTIVGISGTILTGVLLKKSVSPSTAKVAQEVIPASEELFNGVPLSKLTELAKQIYHGLYCTID